MQKYRFTQQVKVKDKTFSVGIHAVTEQQEGDKDFLHFVRCGWITEAPQEAVVAKPVAVDEHAKRLAERIEKRLAGEKAKLHPETAKPGKPPAPPAETWDPTPVPTSETEEDDGGEQPEEALTPAQKAARTRKANAEAKAAEKAKEA